MTTTDHPASETTITRARRVQLLLHAPGFAGFATSILEALSLRLRERACAPGEIVVKEGDAGDELFLIVNGRAEVSADGPGGAVPLAHLGDGEIFGEIALLEPGGRRHATVTAATSLSLLVLGADDFHGLLQERPDARQEFDVAAHDMRVAKFLKQFSPFMSLQGGQLRQLAGRLRTIHVEAGTEILTQGTGGDGACLLQSGKVEVLLRDGDADADGPQRRICTLNPGALFGEGALLTDAPRSATVRALESCELLALSRRDLLDLMAGDQGATGSVLELLQLRQRPRQRLGVTAHARTGSDGETITVLKDAQRGAYYRLSPEGMFLWSRLDGRHTLRDLTMDYLTQFKAFSPQAIAGIVVGLASAGFIETGPLRSDVTRTIVGHSIVRRVMASAARLLDRRASIPHVDEPLGRIYRALRWLYAPPAQAMLGIIATAGLVAFFLIGGRAHAAFHTGAAGLWVLWFLIPAWLVSIVIHELGHALTTKAFGREVPRVGVGWYWFGPVAYVDTSDMWLADRWPRIAVTLAGPYANVVLAAAASIVGYFATSPMITATMWLFALVSYVIVLFNLNPLLEYDGYYVLMDWLERPNFRGEALAWLGSEFPVLIRGRAKLTGHVLDLFFAVASLLYIASMVTLTVMLYRASLQGWMAHWLPAWLAVAIAWLLAGGVAFFGLAGALADLRANPGKQAT